MYNYIDANDLKEPGQTDSVINRTYKDSVFRKLFNNKTNALSLYNALTGRNLPEDVEIQFTTLEDVIYMTRKNDVSFLLEDVFIILFEQQSTINPNMGIRDLIYYATTIQRMYNNKKFYDASKVILPRPEFIMLYNGVQDMADYSELKLSDNFAGEGEINLQLTVKVYNINESRNPEIMEKCEVLAQYSQFVSTVREAVRKGTLSEPGLRQLFQKCIDEGILPDFLMEYGKEAVNMLFEEFTQEEVNEIYKRNGLAEGRAEGLAEGAASMQHQIAVNMLKEGMAVELIERVTGLPKAEIETLRGTAEDLR